VPAAGYVLVIATTQANIYHTNGTGSRINFGVSETTAFPPNQDVLEGVNSDVPSGAYYRSVTSHGLFSVGAAGTYTYNFLAELIDAGANIDCHDQQLTLLYIPTSYGTVNPTAAGGISHSDDQSREKPAIKEADIAAERAASIADNDARIQRELDRMRAEIEELKREMERSEDRIKR
jgi:hypothetical protein